jgi:nucleotide-binding universal stress UspA family protein
MTILVAYSPDDYGRAALDYGVLEATRNRERLVVVNVTRGDAVVDVRYAGTTDAQAVEDRLAALPVDTDFRQSMSEDVADEVLAIAAVENPRLLVVGIRHRTPVGKLLLGSVAQRLILEARCPVVAVKPGLAGFGGA